MLTINNNTLHNAPLSTTLPCKTPAAHAVRRVPRVMHQYRHDPYAPLTLHEVCVAPYAAEPPCWCAECMRHGSSYPYSVPPYAAESYCATVPLADGVAQDHQQRLQLVYQNGRPMAVSLTNHSLQDISFEAPTEVPTHSDESYRVEEEEAAATHAERFEDGDAVEVVAPQTAWNADGVMVVVGMRNQSHRSFLSTVPVRVGDHVVVEADRGEDVGVVAAIEGTVLEAAPRKVAKGKGAAAAHDEDGGRILRVASAVEVRRWTVDQTAEEAEALEFARAAARGLRLDMHILRCAYQFDHKKLSFQFEAPDRVMFVPLAKALHREYRCRIWLEQVNRVSLKPGGAMMTSN